MIADYVRDISTANQKYENKNIKITGQVISKGQFKNTSNFFIIAGTDYYYGKSYSLLLDYPIEKVDEVNKLNVGDFVVAEGSCIGVVPQDDPSDISIQIKVGKVAMISDSESTASVIESTSQNLQQVSSNLPNQEFKQLCRRLPEFESRLSDFANRINNGNEAKSSLIASGNVLVRDIQDAVSASHAVQNPKLSRELADLFNIQIIRVNCMLDGINGNTTAFAEGGRFYDEFYSKYNPFKVQHSL